MTLESKKIEDELKVLEKTIIQRVDSKFEKDDSYKAFSECSSMITDFCTLDVIRKYIQLGLQKTYEEPNSDALELSSGARMFLFGGKYWAVYLDHTNKRKADVIMSNIHNAMLYNIGPRALRTELYSLPEDFDPRLGVVDPQKDKLKENRTSLLKVGDKLLLKANTTTAAFCNENYSTYMIKFYYKNPSRDDRLIWAFDKNSLLQLTAVAAYPKDTEIEIGVKALGALQNKSSINLIRKLTEYDPHFIRWAAIQALAELDTEACIYALHKAIEDEHPEIRRKAIKALKLNEALVKKLSMGEYSAPIES